MPEMPGQLSQAVRLNQFDYSCAAGSVRRNFPGLNIALGSVLSLFPATLWRDCRISSVLAPARACSTTNQARTIEEMLFWPLLSFFCFADTAVLTFK